MPLTLQCLAWLLVIAPMISLGYFTLEVLSGLWPLRRRLPPVAARCAVLIPAHNEGLGIGDTVRALRASLPGDTRILVVADNCADDTAACARAAGAEVIERHDAARRGKGYALAFGRDHLRADPPEVVAVIDADCRLAPGSLEALAAAVMHTGRPAQAINLVEPDLTLPTMTQISVFAVIVKNLFRLRGLSRIGGCSLLCGTGMAFAWHDFARASLATGNVVEDLALTITMIREGTRPLLVEDARVTSPSPALQEGINQRSRWEHGFLVSARRNALPALAQGVLRFRRGPLALGLHLIVPPLALLGLISLVMLALSAILARITGHWQPTAALLAVCLLAGIAVTLAWVREGRAALSFKSLTQAPRYIFWKLPIYMRFLRGRGRQTDWNRTRRDGED